MFFNVDEDEDEDEDGDGEDGGGTKRMANLDKPGTSKAGWASLGKQGQTTPGLAAIGATVAGTRTSAPPRRAAHPVTSASRHGGLGAVDVHVPMGKLKRNHVSKVRNNLRTNMEYSLNFHATRR